MTFHRFARLLAACTLTLGFSAGALAQLNEAQLRKTLAERVPSLPKIDEISKSPIPGLVEIRIGNEIYYGDEKGDYIVQGVIIDTRTRSNVTEARIDKLTAVDFATLPVKDAVVFKQGTGARKLAVFVDPLCGYCKRFERDVMTVKDVTIYTFIYPILGPESTARSRDIWCSKDAGKAWRGWMIDGQAPPKATGPCDTAAIDRVVEFGKKHRVQGTPALFFEDGTRKPGALSAADVEKLLAGGRKS